MPERPNFYVLLELDPAIRDWTVIEERIRAKRDEWSRERSQGAPKARARAEQCQRWLPEIERCLEDPASREREAKKAESLRAQEHARQVAELDELIDLIRRGGGACDPERLERLAGKFTGVFSREEIRERLRHAGVEVEGDPWGEAADEPDGEIDRQTAREIRQRLDLLGLRDLYDLVGLPRTASPERLRARAGEIYRENRRAGRHDAMATAQNDLASYCTTVFACEASKTAYDRYLTVEAMERLAERIDLAGADGLLTREEVEALVAKAVELGVEAEAARAYLESLARERGWKVDPGAAPRAERATSTGSTSPEPEPDRLGRYIALLAPHLRALARRPAVAVPAGLTALGMATVLAASVGAPGAAVPAPVAPTAQAASSSAEASAGASQPSSAAQGRSSTRAGQGASAAAGAVALPLTKDDESVPPQAGSLERRTPAAPAAPSRAARPSRPAPSTLSLPREPRIAVLAVGDEWIGPLVEDTVASALREAGLQVHDKRGSLGLTERLRSARGQPPISEIARSLAAEDFDVLVLAEIDPIAQRELKFYGRTELATTSRVRLSAYSLFDQRSLGGGWRGEVEHTERGAARQVPRALAPAGVTLATEIADGWDLRIAQLGN